MALFLGQQQLYRLIQRELPEDVYPDAGDAAKYLSTSDSWALAGILADAYDQLRIVYNGYWPQTIIEGEDSDAQLAQHEITRFGLISNALTFSQRVARLLTKIRGRPSLSVSSLEETARAELPPDTVLQIVEWGCISTGGSWYIGESELGWSTIFGGGGNYYPPGTDICTKDGSDVGLTPAQWANYQDGAYTYELRIYEYTPTATELQSLERVMTRAEPSEAKHLIRTNVALSEFVDPYLPVMEAPP